MCQNRRTLYLERLTFDYLSGVKIDDLFYAVFEWHTFDTQNKHTHFECTLLTQEHTHFQCTLLTQEHTHFQCTLLTPKNSTPILRVLFWHPKTTHLFWVYTFDTQNQHPFWDYTFDTQKHTPILSVYNCTPKSKVTLYSFSERTKVIEVHGIENPQETKGKLRLIFGGLQA